MSSLVCADTKTRVSSVLNRDVKQFGKKYMFDGDPETCWNSDQGSPQWCQIEFPHQVELHNLHIKFQGGFVGKDCSIEDLSNDEPKLIMKFYPDDVNSLQVFPLPEGCAARKIRINFTDSTDFFGRITIYALDVV